MRIFKLFFETILFITFFSVFYFVTILPVHYSIITSIIITHTIFWLLFCPIWYPITCSLNMGCIYPNKLIKYAESLNSRLQKENFILCAMITGSMSRGELHKESDLDIKIIRKNGFKNLLSAIEFIVKETLRAQASRIPLELLMSNSVEYLNKMNTDESPIALFDPHRIIKKKFKKHYLLNDIYKINKRDVHRSPYRIVVYSEILKPPFDEGIRKTAYELIKALSRKAKLIAICKVGIESENPTIRVIPSNRLLISRKLKKEIREFSPSRIIYIPPACGTLWAFIRCKMLSYYTKDREVILMLLQPRKYDKIKKFILHFLKPYKVLSPSSTVITALSEIGMDVDFLPLGVDPKVFKPVNSKPKKIELRNKYGLPIDRSVILHVGHINKERNLDVLTPLQTNNTQVVVVGSTSTPTREKVDKVLKEKLQKNGIIITNRYIEHIEEIYQLSDIYVFPVTSELGTIGIPLSILEANACGLPVVSTNIGGIPKIIANKKLGILIEPKGIDELPKVALKSLEIEWDKDYISNYAKQFTWDRIAEKIVGGL